MPLTRSDFDAGWADGYAAGQDSMQPHADAMHQVADEWKAEAERLRSECAVCEKCGHVQAEPNWCHECRHRTTPPDWAKPLLDAWSDRQNLREAISDALADMQPGVWPHSLLTDALKASESLDD